MNGVSGANGVNGCGGQRPASTATAKPGKGKGLKANTLLENLPLPRPPPITVNSLHPGEVVDVFHRYSQDPNGYFMVQYATSGIHHPSIGLTDGWTEARISEAWSRTYFNPADYRTWVEIQWMHPTWYNRRGHRLDVTKPNMITQRVLPEQIRQRHSPSEAQQQPVLTLFHFRWGGEHPVNPVTEGAGGWGQIGSTPSDNYINGWEETVFQTLGPTYEIISAFIQSSEELTKINAPLLRHLGRGKQVGALYFMWPILFQDGHEFPAYVWKDKQFALMGEMEATGVPSRFPHSSHLYRVFASKEWTAQMCLHPLLRVPLTTQVARESIARDSAAAAHRALTSLNHLAEARTQFWAELAQPEPASAVTKGVAKLGWSWEAMDVQAWTTKQELANNLVQLVEQPGSLVDLCFVQEWVDFDVEMRHFVVEADLARPQSWKPQKIVYTVFKSKETGSFRNFDRFDRGTCIKTCFGGDAEALADAEQQAQELIGRWLQWLQGISSELPVVCRFDILARRTGPGKASVMTGELTELGGCFLGWPKGPQVVFGAMLRSCLRVPPPGAS